MSTCRVTSPPSCQRVVFTFPSSCQRVALLTSHNSCNLCSVVSSDGQCTGAVLWSGHCIVTVTVRDIARRCWPGARSDPHSGSARRSDVPVHVIIRNICAGQYRGRPFVDIKSPVSRYRTKFCNLKERRTHALTHARTHATLKINTQLTISQNTTSTTSTTTTVQHRHCIHHYTHSQ